MKIDWRTVGAFVENSYLVVDDSGAHAVLIDPGDEPDRLIEMVRESGATLDAIWLTHAHLDHIGGIEGIRRQWPVPVHLHDADREIYDRGAELAAVYDVPFEQPGPPDRSLRDGDVLSLGAHRFDVIHVPGHAPGHVLLVHDGIIFGGDLLFAGSVGTTDIPFGDPIAMEQSLAKIMQFGDDIVVYPGHGPATTIGEERATNPFLSDAVRVATR